MLQNKTILIFCGLCIGVLAFLLLRVAYVSTKFSTTTFTPHQVHITLKPPTASLTALVDALKGSVKKDGRLDTNFKTITKSSTLVEGESIATEYASSATLTIPQVVTAKLGQYTQLDYVNGLADKLVIRQPNGIVTYTTSTIISPFSVRSLALLTQWSDPASLTITTDAANQTVNVRVRSGTVTLGYSDATNTTQVQQLTGGQGALFDNTASTLIQE